MSHEKARVLVAMWNGRWSTSEKGKDNRNIGNRIREDEEERVRRPTDRNETLGYQVFCNALSELGEGKKHSKRQTLTGPQRSLRRRRTITKSRLTQVSLSST